MYALRNGPSYPNVLVFAIEVKLFVYVSPKVLAKRTRTRSRIARLLSLSLCLTNATVEVVLAIARTAIIKKQSCIENNIRKGKQLRITNLETINTTEVSSCLHHQLWFIFAIFIDFIDFTFRDRFLQM